MKTICGTLFTRNDFKDVTGCLKEIGHNDAHVCKSKTGELIEWEDDYSCDCGCWDDYDNDPDVCCVYRIVDNF